MARWVPCKRSAFIRRLRRLGFEGLFPGGKHQFMVYGEHRMTIPTNREFSVPQLRLLLREVGNILGRTVTEAEWDEL